MDIEEYIDRVKRLAQKLQNGKYDEAIEDGCQLCNARPERVGAHLILAQAFSQKGEIEKASKALEEASLHCTDLALQINLAIIYVKQEKNKEANDLFSKVCSKGIKISNPKFWFFYAKNSSKLGKFDEAISQYQKCLKLKPDHKAALNNLANIFQKRENFTKAEEYYKTLLSYYPKEGMAYCNIGSLYERLKKSDLAIQYYEKGLLLSPRLSILYFNLGQIYANELQDHSKALEIFNTGLNQADETYRMGIRFYQIIARQHIINWSEYEEDVKGLNEILEWYVTTKDPVFEIVPYALSYSKVDPKLYRRVAEKYASKISLETHQKFPDTSYDHTLSNGKVKIGYLSPNFRKHPGGTLVREIFDYHDSKQFETYAFSLVHTGDWVNKQIKDSVDYYYDVSKYSSVEIAELINRTGIDVLVSLAGYNTAMKFDLLALKPAPVQMVIIGSHETTGADFIDYIFSDEYMLDESLRKNFTEKVISLPCSLLINSKFPVGDTPKSSRADHGLPEKSFVFANFNHPKKLNPETFGAWMEILKNTPNSVLWLYNGGQVKFNQLIRENAKALNVDPERIVFAENVDIKLHWERFHHADLFLDNFNYNAHVTGIEALRSGVPMISLKGNNHNSRLGASLLKYSGLEKLICLTKNDYITLSSQLATSAAELNSMKEKLQVADNVMLFDTELQVKYLEKAYKKALLKFKRGKEPEDFRVGSALDLNSFTSD